MFEEMLRELRRLEGAQEVAVPVAPDRKGHIDREYPSSECLFQFKVHGDDWRDKARNEEVFYPFCGHDADAGKWWTYEQVEHARESAVAHIAASAAPWNANDWNRRQPRNSFFRITMEVNSRPRHVLLPLPAAEPM